MLRRRTLGDIICENTGGSVVRYTNLILFLKGSNKKVMKTPKLGVQSKKEGGGDKLFSHEKM